MAQQLAARLEEMERSRAELLGPLEELDHEQLNRPPAEGGWSVAQVLGHLILAESLTLGYMRKKIRDPSKLQRESWVHALRSRLLTVALRSPFRFTSPPAAADPPADRDYASLRQEWDETRRGLGEFIAACPPDLGDRAIYRHPVAGPMSLERCLIFVAEHIEHHQRQIDRLLAEIR